MPVPPITAHAKSTQQIQLVYPTYSHANIFFSNSFKSQQDLQLLLEEGELEEQLKNMLEADLETINTTTTAAEYKRSERHDFDTQSKDTSHSGSIPGSEPLSRKEFMLDGLKYSPAGSMQGSKASLSSSLHKGSKASLSSTPPKGSKASLMSETRLKGSKASLVAETLPKGSKASLVAETPPKGSKASLVAETPPKGSKASLVAETPPKGSKASLVAETPPKESKVGVVAETPPKENERSLVSEMPPKESKQSLTPETHSKGSKGSLLSETPSKGTAVNIESETPESLPSEPSPQKEERDSKEASSVDIKVSKVRSEECGFPAV